MAIRIRKDCVKWDEVLGIGEIRALGRHHACMHAWTGKSVLLSLSAIESRKSCTSHMFCDDRGIGRSRFWDQCAVYVGKVSKS